MMTTIHFFQHSQSHKGTIALILFITVAIYLPVVHAQKEAACSRGTFKKDGNCIPCPPGTYSSTFNATKCTPCPAGTFFSLTGAQTANACQRCPEDAVSTEGSSECTPCQPGFVAGASPKCIRCPPGTQITDMFSFQGIQTKECAPCFPSSYSDTFNAQSCNQCPNGSNSKQGSKSKDDCQMCPPGTSSSGSGCEPCPAGTFFDGVTPNPSGSTVNGCFPCPTGFQSGIGSAKCTPCQPGEVGVAFNGFIDASCEKCPNGTTTFGEAATLCREFGTPCPADHFEDKLGDCRSCTNIERFDPSKLACVPCGRNERTLGGKDETCVQCADIVNTDLFFENGCGIIVAQELATKENGKCPPGSFISPEEPDFCVLCFPGEFSNITDATECQKCPPDAIAREFGSTKCESCPGELVFENQLDKCVIPQTRCPPGQAPFPVESSSDQCERTDCPNPRPEFGRSPDSCSLCGSRTIQSKINPEECVDCAFDEISTDGLECQKCPNGLVASAFFENECSCSGQLAAYRGVVNGVCQKCPVGQAGKFDRESGENVCEICEPGTFYRDEPEGPIGFCLGRACTPIEVCSPCEKGFFTDKPGSLKCTPCPEGTTTGGTGEVECKPVTGPEPTPSSNKPMSSDESPTPVIATPSPDAEPDIFQP